MCLRVFVRAGHLHHHATEAVREHVVQLAGDPGSATRCCSRSRSASPHQQLAAAPAAPMPYPAPRAVNAYAMAIAAGYRDDDVFLHAAPMFHLADASSVYALTWLGARHVFVPRSDPGEVLDLMHGERVTCTILVPAMIGTLLRHPAVDTDPPTDLRLLLHGGAPMDPSLLRRAVETLRCGFGQAYGLTESSSLATMLPDEERLLDDPR